MRKYIIIPIVLVIAIAVFAQPITPSGTRFFKYLFDTPDSYTDQGGKGLRVNSGADALEFYTIVSGITGNYVATIADGTGIDGTASGEGSTYTPIFDPTELNALTWSDGTNSSNIWTFDVSGTDHTMTAGNALMTFSKGLTVTLDLIVSGGDITLGTTSIFSGGDTASLNNIDALNPTTEATIEAAIDTLSNLTSIGTITSATSITTDDLITKSPWVDIRAFGGVGDNNTDNTAALQAAHDALPAWGGTIYFPGGTAGYRFDGTVAFTKGQIKLVSDYWASAYIRSYTTDPLWTFTGPSYASRISNIKIENLLFVPHLVDCGHALQFTYVERPVLEHVYIINSAAEAAQNIDDITLAGTDPVSIELTGHGFATGEAIWFASVGGTTELDNNLYVITRTDDDNFTLDSTDSSDYSAFTAGGTATQYNTFNNGFYFIDCNFGRCIDIRATRCRNMGFLWRNNVNAAGNSGFNLYMDDGYFLDNANLGASIENVHSSRIINTSFSRNTFGGLYCWGNQDAQVNYPDAIWLQNNEYDSNGGIGLYVWKWKWVFSDNDWISSGRIENKPGAYFRACEALSINNPKAFYCGSDGLKLEDCIDVQLSNINSSNNDEAALSLENCTRVLGRNLNLSQTNYTVGTGGYTQEYGLYIIGTDDVQISGLTASGNNTKDVIIETSTNVHIDSPVIKTLANNATPSVAGFSKWLTDGTTTITDFDDGVEGQKITIISEHSITITDGTNIYLKQSANWGMVFGDALTLLCKADNKWYELSSTYDAGAGGGNAWSDAVDSDILPTGNDNIYDLGSVAASFKDGYFQGTLEAGTLTEGGNAVWNATETDIIDSAHYIAGSIDEEHLNITNAPGAGEDNYVLTYNHAATNFTWAPDADSGGATAYDDIGNPDAAGSISFDDNETATYTTAQDSAGSFFSLINSNATVSNQVYMLDIDYSADTTEDNADFIRLQDAGSTLIVFEEEGKLTMTPSGVDDATIISIVPSVALTQSDAAWYGIKIDGDALDPGDVDNIIIGVEIDLSGVDTTNNPYVEALELKMYAGGTALHIEEGGVDHFYTIGGDAGATYAVYDIVVDGSSQAATSETHIIDVEVANGDPDGEIVAVSTHTYVAPIHQHIGTYTTPDQVGADSEAGFFDDSATDYIDGVDGIEQFTFDDDAIWISNAAVFHSLEVSMTSDATRSIVPTFWYWKDDTPDLWTEFHPLDTTEGFQHSGTISWDADDVPSWLSADVVELSAGDSSEAAAGYWIAIVRTVGADPGTPTPTTVKTGTVVLYEWDETGAVDLLSLEADTITEGGNAVWNATETEIIDSDHYTDGSIDHEHLAADVISGMTNVTSEDADYILIWDNTDSALKKVDMGEVRGGSTKWNAIGDADGVGSIDFVTYTQTIDIGKSDSGGGSGLILDVTGLGAGTDDVIALEITTVANGDTDYIPIAVYDDSGTGNDLLFRVDSFGTIYVAGNLAFGNGGALYQPSADTFEFADNTDEFQIYFGGTDVDLIWFAESGALNLRCGVNTTDSLVNILGKDAGEKGILRVLSDGDDKYIELYHDDTDAHIISNSGDIHIEASGGNIVTTNNVLANGNLSVGNAGTTAGVLTLLEDDDDGSNFASFTVPALGTNTVYILPPDDGDNTEVLQTNGSGTLTWVANAGGGATAWDDISDPDNNGLTTITFDNTEAILFTGDNDATVSFITIQNSDADHTGGNMYLLDLDYSADDGDVDADFIKFQDSGSVVMTIQQNGDITTDGGLTSSGTVEGATLTEGGNAVWNSTETDFLTNEHIDWANIDYLADEGALTVVDSTYASAYVAIFDSATGNLQAKTDGALTYDATSGTLAATQFSGGGGSLTGVDAATGDAAVDFFGAGVDAVTDATTCTDIEGTGLSIGGTTLNWAAASTDLTDTAALLYETELDDFSELQTQIADKTLVNTADGAVWSGTHDFGGANLEIPQATPAVPSVDGEIEFDFTDGSLVIQHGSAHTELGSPTDVVVGKLIRCWGGTIFEPDAINDVMTVKAINSIEFPHGVVITAIYLGVSENTSYTLTVQNFDDFDTINGVNGTIDAVTYTADTTGEIIDTSPTYDTIAAGQLIMISIPSTDVDWIHFEIYYYEPAA